MTHNLTSYQNTDLNRTDPNFDIVAREELDNTIKSIRQKVPGQSGITKIHLTNLPANMTEDFLTIINAN